MALNGLTPAEKLATFAAAASHLQSLTVPQSPAPTLSPTLGCPPIAALIAQVGESVAFLLPES